MLAGVVKGRRGHDVGGRVDPLPPAHHGFQCLVQGAEVRRRPLHGAMGALQRFPGVHPVEDLEEQRPKEDLARFLRTGGVVLDMPDQVLADTVRRTVCVREAVGAQDGVVGPGAVDRRQPTMVGGHPLGREPPIGVVDRGRLGWSGHVALLACVGFRAGHTSRIAVPGAGRKDLWRAGRIRGRVS